MTLFIAALCCAIMCSITHLFTNDFIFVPSLTAAGQETYTMYIQFNTSSSTAMGNTATEVKVVKLLRGEKVYTVEGQEMK